MTTDSTVRPEWELPPEPRVWCKHGAGDCARCGVTERRDVMHRTVVKKAPSKLKRRRKAK